MFSIVLSRNCNTKKKVYLSLDRETTPNIQNTLAIIKPDGMQGHKEAIIQKIKENGFHLVQEREIQLSKEQVALFYREHEGKPFYNDLTTWMSR
jgi:nucleoside diphosphate kinase